MNIYIGKGTLVHTNPPLCKTTYTSPVRSTSKPVTCPGCQGKKA